jgi:hypothetical protein
MSSSNPRASTSPVLDWRHSRKKAVAVFVVAVALRLDAVEVAAVPSRHTWAMSFGSKEEQTQAQGWVGYTLLLLLLHVHVHASSSSTDHEEWQSKSRMNRERRRNAIRLPRP